MFGVRGRSVAGQISRGRPKHCFIRNKSELLVKRAKKRRKKTGETNERGYSRNMVFWRSFDYRKSKIPF